MKCTSEAMTCGTRLPVKGEQDMGWAHQPIFMGRVKLNRVAKTEHARPSHERDIVEVNDVVVVGLEDLANLAGVRPRLAGLMGYQCPQARTLRS